MTGKKKTTNKRNLYRVIFRAAEYLGTAEQFHAKVVAPDFSTAMTQACDALGLDKDKLDGAAVTLIHENTELADGKVFDFARRSRGFGERGAWTFKDLLPRKEGSGPRQTEAL
jgi:hypothetical protein